jgi:protein gp37
VKNSHIEWTDHTFNPCIGCTKVSPGCTHCYAEGLNKRWKKGENWGKGAPRQRTSESYWKQPLAWNSDIHIATCPKCGRTGPYTDVCPTPNCLTLGSEMECHRPRVFCASLADWLDDEVPYWWALKWLDKVGGISPANVWIGTTVENQEMADERIPILLSIPAKVRFLSCEPLLENVFLPNSLINWSSFNGGINWVICGGESGPGARPMHPSWARNLRDQCQSAGVPFFFKQWGEYVWRKTWAESTGTKHIFADGVFVNRVGKTAAGRDLDGRTWNEFPKVEVAA